jgi:thiamine biosynthesis lipoprotein
MISTPSRSIFLIAVALLQALAACDGQRPDEYQLSGPTMGTSFSVVVVTASAFDQQRLQTQIYAALEDIDRQMSTYRADAELAAFNRSSVTDWMPVSPALCKAVDHALELGAFTAGAFDITVGPLVNLWGFGPDGPRNEPPVQADIAAAQATTGRDKLQTDCELPAIRKHHAAVHVDLSGYAKGLAADQIAAVLDNSGISNYLVEVGGDLRVRGHNASQAKWRVAIEKPDPPRDVVEKIIHVSDLSVATSGDYRNFFEFEGERFSHTIDPRSGRPVAHALASVTVLGDTAAYADAIATALMVLGPDTGFKFAEREGIAAFFLLRDEGALSERASTRFEALVSR